ncbi:MAG TPA: cytochrome c peroxidase [Sediminibacterium sp.]|nr:cytochrome c peroxidase [Sediminibacterium sp.]
MKYARTRILACLALGAFCCQFCSKSASTGGSAVTGTDASSAGLLLPAVPYAYSAASYPAYILTDLAQNDNTPADNPITDNGATLGRVLFYDKNLSQNQTISCSSCHNPSLSFSDTAVKSRGFAGGLTTRHSMALLNVRFYRSGKMFWDERANTLEDQVLQPIQNTTEMGMTLDQLVSRINNLTYYPVLFKNAFGTTEVSANRVSKALAQFVRSIVTYQSRYDQVKQGRASFTADEAAGETLFLTAGNQPCGGCHKPPMFLTSDPAAPFGLPDPTDHGINNQNRFKSGSLRNIALTAPYFHNGSVASLQTMLANGIPAHTVAPQDRAKILAFLQTLTDATVSTDIKFSNPFQP